MKDAGIDTLHTQCEVFSHRYWTRALTLHFRWECPMPRECWPARANVWGASHSCVSGDKPWSTKPPHVSGACYRISKGFVSHAVNLKKYKDPASWVTMREKWMSYLLIFPCMIPIQLQALLRLWPSHVFQNLMCCELSHLFRTPECALN